MIFKRVITIVALKLYNLKLKKQAQANRLSNPHTLYKFIVHWTYDISRALVGNTIVDPSDVVGSSPVGAAPTTSSLST